MLVSLVITAIVLAGVYASFSAVMDTRRRVEAGSNIDMQARLVLTRISHEIESAFLVKRAQEAPPESRYTVFSGSQTEVEGRPGDRLSFSAFAHTKRGIDADESDQSVVEYTTEENEPEDGVERTAALLRREWRRIPPPGDTQRVTTPRAIALLEDMRGFRVRFRDADGEWTDRWDSTEVRTLDQMPTAVEITLTLRDGSGRDRDFVTVASPRIVPFERGTTAAGDQGAAPATQTGETTPTTPQAPAGAPSSRGGSR